MGKNYFRFNQGDLVISGRAVVLVTSRYGNPNIGYPCFAGVLIVEDPIETPEFKVGMYSRTWVLSAFKKMNCKINLMQLPKEVKTY